MLLFSNAWINVKICWLPRRTLPQLWQKKRKPPQMNCLWIICHSKRLFLTQCSFKYLFVEKVENHLLNKKVELFSPTEKKGRAMSKVIEVFQERL